MDQSHTRRQVGTLISGSLSEGLTARISASTVPGEVRSGKFVTIVGPQGSYFFSLITDLHLDITNPDIALHPPQPDEMLFRRTIERFLVTRATLRPLLMLNSQGQKTPVKTVPPHFSPIFEASEMEISLIFGSEKEKPQQYFAIGTPLDMETSVCLDLDALTERSSGIFGKTGTGKTFLTRLLIAGLINKQKAVSLIFDMHSEYGHQARREGSSSPFVKGLKTLFPDRVSLFSLDPASTRRRGASPDATVSIPYQAIDVQDILSLQKELNLHPTACEAAYLIAAKYRKNWLFELLQSGSQLKELADAVGAHPESIAALYRKLKQIEKLPFVTPQEAAGPDSIDLLISFLNRGTSVIIEFGNFTSTFCYLLMANIITRRVHSLYIEKTEKFLGSQQSADEPKKLLIVIEEAHKFLAPIIAQQTIFGIIAREMRKYYVSLLIVDQRPSEIDPDILSQVGTKIIAQLNDEKDINAVFSGIYNAGQLRTILTSLESKRQILVVGHAIAMPIVLEARSYDETFYQQMGTQVRKQNLDELVNQLF